LEYLSPDERVGALRVIKKNDVIGGKIGEDTEIALSRCDGCEVD